MLIGLLDVDITPSSLDDYYHSCDQHSSFSYCIKTDGEEISDNLALREDIQERFGLPQLYGSVACQDRLWRAWPFAAAAAACMAA